MFCTKCGSQNDDSARFCHNCGSALQLDSFSTPSTGAAVPSTPPPPMAVPGSMPAYTAKPRKRYMAEFSLGLTGAIIGSIMFFIIAIFSILEFTGDLYMDAAFEGVVSISAVFCLASFVLGFVGSAQISKGNLGGGVSLLVGAILGFLAMFISLPGLYTLFYWPLILAGGITALARRSTLRKTGEYPL